MIPAIKGYAAVLTWSDGRPFIDPHTIRPAASSARTIIAQDYAHRFGVPLQLGWRRAYRAGWRVVRVKIEVVEGGGV